MCLLRHSVNDGIAVADFYIDVGEPHNCGSPFYFHLQVFINVPMLLHDKMAILCENIQRRVGLFFFAMPFRELFLLPGIRLCSFLLGYRNACFRIY